MEEKVIKLEPGKNDDTKYGLNETFSFENLKDDSIIKNVKLFKEELKPEIQSDCKDINVPWMPNNLKGERVDHLMPNNKTLFNTVMIVGTDHDCKSISDTKLPLNGGSDHKVKTEVVEDADDKKLVFDLKKLIKNDEIKRECDETLPSEMFGDATLIKNPNFDKKELKNSLTITENVQDNCENKISPHDCWNKVKVKKDIFIETKDGQKLDRHFTEAIKGIFSEEEAFEVDTVDLEDLSSIPEELLSSISGTNSSNRKKYKKELKFPCLHCGRRFTQTNLLRQHIRVHTGEKPHVCKFCEKSFRTKHLLGLHSQIHTGKRYECKFCNRRFNTPYLVKKHTLVHKGIKNFKCSYCKAAFHHKEGLIKHVTNVNCSQDKNHTLVQKLLKKTSFGTKQTPKNPLRKNLICHDCGKTFAEKNSLLQHVRNCHLNERTYHHCKICNRMFLSKSNCRKHERLHENVYPFSCEICGLSFKEKGGLIRHIKITHLSYKPFKCKPCNTCFDSKSNLTSHQEVHHNSDKANKYFCEICNTGFYRIQYLKRHVKIHTGTDKKYICDYCGLKCRSKRDIELHILTHIGGGEKPFKCEVCGKAFSKQSHHQRHLLVHSDDRPFKCKLCDKAYKDSESLKLHQNVHTKKTYTCDACGFVSINERSFKRHISNKICKKQTFTCEICEKPLSSQQFLKKHMKGKHPGEK